MKIRLAAFTIFLISSSAFLYSQVAEPLHEAETENAAEPDSEMETTVSVENEISPESEESETEEISETAEIVETDESEENAGNEVSETQPEMIFDDTESSENPRFFSIIGTIGPTLMINTDDSKNSAPSPVTFSVGAGATFFESFPVYGEARLLFFTNYYLWDGKNAQPAEVENRTVTALSFMLDLTGGHVFKFGRNFIEVNAGIGFLFRAGFLSLGVKDDDPGYTGDSETSTAKDDASSITSWFYDGSNFLYPEVAISYLRQIKGSVKFGGELRVYFPAGTLSNGEFPDDMIFALSAKVGF